MKAESLEIKVSCSIKMTFSAANIHKTIFLPSPAQRRSNAEQRHKIFRNFAKFRKDMKPIDRRMKVERNERTLIIQLVTAEYISLASPSWPNFLVCVCDKLA